MEEVRRVGWMKGGCRGGWTADEARSAAVVEDRRIRNTKESGKRCKMGWSLEEA